MATQVSISFSAQLNTPANTLQVGLYLASAPTVLVDSKTPTKAGSPPYYTNPFNTVFTGLTYGAAYIVVLWESSDNAPDGENRCEMQFVAYGQSITLRADLHVYGGDTGATINQPTYVDTSLVGCGYSLEEVGNGTLDPTNRPAYTVNSGGGWTLTNGENIQQDQHFVHHFEPQISAIVAPAPSLISTGQIIAVTTTLDNTYVNQALYLRGTSTNFAITLPSLAVVGDYQQIIFYSAGGNHINVSIDCAGSDMIYRTIPVAEIVLAQNEKLVLYKANGVWNVADISETVDIVGQLVWSHNSSEPGCLLLNGNASVPIADYKRLYNLIVNRGANGFISQATWSANKGKFAYTSPNVNMNIPDASNGEYFYVNNSDSGIFRQFMALAHQHLTVSGSSGGGGAFGQWATSIVLKLFGSSSTTNKPDLTGGMTDATGTAMANTGTTVRPISQSIFVHVRF